MRPLPRVSLLASSGARACPTRVRLFCGVTLPARNVVPCVESGALRSYGGPCDELALARATHPCPEGGSGEKVLMVRLEKRCPQSVAARETNEAVSSLSARIAGVALPPLNTKDDRQRRHQSTGYRCCFCPHALWMPLCPSSR